jgi:TetR/AcrR family transcriptional regulator, lmrAB and yxaGH operons repressor
MARTSDARAKALKTAERLVRSQGAAATGVAQIIAESGAPKGSFYFHFPGGKEQLLLEMLDGYASVVSSAIERLAGAVEADAAAFADAFCAAIAADMKRDQFTHGCALQALSDEYANADVPISRAILRHTDEWLVAIARALGERGVGAADAGRLALWLTTMTQGARMMARVVRSTAPFDAVRTTIPAVFGTRSAGNEKSA